MKFYFNLISGLVFEFEIINSERLDMIGVGILLKIQSKSCLETGLARVCEDVIPA